MDEGQVWTLIGVNVVLFCAMVTLVIWAVNKLDYDIKSMNTRLDGHAQRIDQVYGVILEMLKDKK